MSIPHQQKTTGQPGLDRDYQVDVQQWVIDKINQVENDVERFRDTEHAKKWLQRAFNQLERDFQAEREWSTARKRFAKKLSRLNERYGLKFLIKPPPLRLRTAPILRNKQMFVARRQVCIAARQFSHALRDTENLSDINHDRLLPLVLFSSVCYGGLCDPEALLAFGQALQQKSTCLKYAPDQNLCWLDFDFESPRSNNIIVDGKPRRMQRFFPDGTTLVLIVGFLKRQPRRTSPYRNTVTLMSRIRLEVSGFCGEPMLKSLSLRQFTKGGIGVAELQPGVKLPHYLVEFACGLIDSVSLPEPYFTAYLGGKRPTAFKQIQLPEVHDKRIQATDGESDPRMDQSEREIRKLFSGLPTDGWKSARKSLIKRFEQTKSTSTSLCVWLLIDWFMHLVSERRLVISTVHRYTNWIGLGWLTQFDGIKLSRLTGEAWYGRYTALIENEPQSRRHKVAGRLDQFHQFLHEKHQYESIPEDLKRNYKDQPFVRARVISEDLFRAFITSLLNADLDDNFKNDFRWIFTLCYRLGTRIGETTRITINDIELSANPIVMLRANRFGTTKSKTPHQLPLYTFLTRDERLAFDDFLNRRRLEAGRRNELLFGPSDKPAYTWDASDLSALFSTLMRQLTGLRFSPHDCRHSAASRLFWYAEDEVPPDGIAYSKSDLNSLCKAVFTMDRQCRDRIWHLSSVFNHHSPEQTFNNYIHFADLMLHKRLSRGQRRVPPRTIQAILRTRKARIRSNEYCNMEGFLIEKVLPIAYETNKRLFEVIKSEFPEAALSRTPEPLDKHPRPNLRSRFVAAQRVLESIENGQHIEDVATSLNVTLDWVMQINESAVRLGSLRTRKGQSRLFSKARFRANANPLSPTRLGEAEDQKTLSALLPQLEDVYNANPNWIVDTCQYWQTHVTTADTKLRFQLPDDVKFFLRCFDGTKAIENSHWLIRVRPPPENSDTKVRDAWVVYPGVRVKLESQQSSKSEKWPNGIAYLYLEKANSSRKGATKESRKLLRFLMHMLSIVLDV